jgi:proteasome lid subunit RPN8/RPN11
MKTKKGEVEVYLSENVFMGIVLSSVEVYKKECFGLLLGYQTASKYIVEHAVPYQSAKRGHKWIELRSDKWKIIQEVLQNFPKLDMIGDFHSHTMYRSVRADVSLSEDDINYMQPNELQLVIAANEQKRSSPWVTNPDNSITGTIDRFHFTLAAYYFPNGNKNGKELHRAEIICPFALGPS